MRARWVLAALTLGALLPASQFSAQQAPVPLPGVIRLNVDLVQVDAVVTDSKGKPVTNLTAEDFELLQDGKAQKLRNFEFVRVKDSLATSTVSPRPVSPRRSDTPPPPPNPSINQVRRTVALVADDLALSFDGTVHVRDALRKWVDTEMQPGDLVSIVRTKAAMGALQQFTNDKRLLYSAIDRLKYQPGRVSVAGFEPFTPGLGMYATPATGRLVERAEIDTTAFKEEVENTYLIGSYNAIKYVIRGLRDLPGRKSLVLFSEDLALPSLDSTGTQRINIEDRLRLLADEANRSSVVIYAIDARGSVYTGLTAEDNVTGRPDATVLGLVTGRMNDFTVSQDGMSLLAQRTGGLFIAGLNDLAGSLRKALDDGNGYYVMGYQPDESTFALKSDTLRYHSIKLRVKRPGLSVRSRSGFYGLSDMRPARAEQETPQALLAKALVSPFTTADLRVHLTTLFSYSDTEGAYLKTLLHFDAHDLAFKDEPDGSRSAMVDIAVVTFDENGEPSQTENKAWTIRIPKDQYEETLRKGLVYSVLVPIKKAGPYQLRVAMRDVISQKLGSAMQFVDVPNVKAGQLALSGIVVTADPHVPGDPEGTPVLRVFKSGAAISYAYEILNAHTDAAKKVQLETQMRLYREGETVFERVPAPLNAGGEKNPSHIPVGGRFELKKIPPGEYVLQVIVFDKLRKDKSAVVAQTVDFEVRQ